MQIARSTPDDEQRWTEFEGHARSFLEKQALNNSEILPLNIF